RRDDEVPLELDLHRAELPPHAGAAYAAAGVRLVERPVGPTRDAPIIIDEAAIAPVEGQVGVTAAVDPRPQLAGGEPVDERSVARAVDLQLDARRFSGLELGKAYDGHAHDRTMDVPSDPRHLELGPGFPYNLRARNGSRSMSLRLTLGVAALLLAG